MENSRGTLLRRIQICDFALLEAHLFLNTHPTDKDALAYYQKYLALQKKATDEYVKKYGPLTAGQSDGGSTWKWVDGPWPWERTSEV